VTCQGGARFRHESELVKFNSFERLLGVGHHDSRYSVIIILIIIFITMVTTYTRKSGLRSDPKMTFCQNLTGF